MATSPGYLGTPKHGVITIVPADTSGLKTVITGATLGTKVMSLLVASDDTSARDVTFGITKNGGSFAPLATKTIPLTAGTVAGVPPVNLLDPSLVPGLACDDRGNPILFLESGDTLQIKSLTTVTTAKTLTIHTDALSA